MPRESPSIFVRFSDYGKPFRFHRITVDKLETFDNDNTMTLDQTPLLSLRMKSLKSSRSHYKNADECLETLAVMIAQDSSYRCRDYLGRRLCRKKSGCGPVQESFSQSSAGEDLADAVCREKMCEWSYRVCDHFQTSREIVAFSFSFLDRFLDRCCCDRTAFKLASMTCLYMATKIFNAKQISVASLAELSRGEFEIDHIKEMERIILETLEWRMNPPTIQSFIENFIFFLGVDDATRDATQQRAVFYAELTAFDYKFVTESRYLVAIACILNAVEGLEEQYLPGRLRQEFLSSLVNMMDLDFHSKHLEEVQGRLWYLYSCSAQMQHDDALPVHISKHHQINLRSSASPGSAHSPVSVRG